MAFATRMMSDSDAEIEDELADTPRPIIAVVSSSSPSSHSRGMLEKLRDGIVGNLMLLSPSPSLFGVDENKNNHPRRRLVYCDWTASGRGVGFVEDYLRRDVLPTYGNTHTSASNAGRQTSCFREESREIIQLACNAHRTKDVVLFCGSGSTLLAAKLSNRQFIGIEIDRRHHATALKRLAAA